MIDLLLVHERAVRGIYIGRVVIDICSERILPSIVILQRATHGSVETDEAVRR